MTVHNSGSRVFSDTTVIASGASLSDAVQLFGTRVVGVAVPGSWTAANLTVQASVDGTTFVNVYDSSGNEYTLTAAASRYIYIDPVALLGAQYIKLRSGTAGSPVNQAADRTLTIVTRLMD